MSSDAAEHEVIEAAIEHHAQSDDGFAIAYALLQCAEAMHRMAEAVEEMDLRLMQAIRAHQSAHRYLGHPHRTVGMAAWIRRSHYRRE